VIYAGFSLLQVYIILNNIHHAEIVIKIMVPSALFSVTHVWCQLRVNTRDVPNSKCSRCDKELASTTDISNWEPEPEPGMHSLEVAVDVLTRGRDGVGLWTGGTGRTVSYCG
jgi:hypothetical protein